MLILVGLQLMRHCTEEHPDLIIELKNHPGSYDLIIHMATRGTHFNEGLLVAPILLNQTREFKVYEYVVDRRVYSYR